MKICCACKVEKSLDNFGKNKSTKDGLQKQCKECRRLTQIKYRNESTGKEICKRYRDSEKGKISQKGTTERYRKTDKYRESWMKTYKKKRLHNAVSARMRQSLNGCKYNRTWESLVGYTLQDLREHLESQFQEGMTWENHSMDGWHIDHIRPIASFNIKTAEDEDFKKCWSLSNLQPLWAKENMSKGDKYEI